MRVVFELREGLRPRVLTALLEALVVANVGWLKRNPGTPKLYASGVRYSKDRWGERFSDIPTTLRRKRGDCEDLSCWRVAELLLEGVAASPYVLEQRGPRGPVFHIMVATGGGLEDPSARLGMRS